MTGFEPLINAAAIGLGNLITETVKNSGGKVLGLFEMDLGQLAKQAIFDASKEYVRRYAERHCTIRVLGMSKPVLLESIYTKVQILDEKESSEFESISELENKFRKSNKRGFRAFSIHRREGVEVANINQYLMVLGGPGTGKSTFLRKMGLEALKSGEEFKHKCIPVFIELKRLTESDLDLKNYIIEEFKICGLPNAARFTTSALEKGKLLILLDGLDEVPDANLNQVVQKIQDFVDTYKKNRYISSCRIAAHRYNFSRFTDIKIAEFDDSQIQQFIQNWFQSPEDLEVKTAENYWDLLQNTENASAKELAHTPLLLTFLCLVYERSQSLPVNRSSLYRRALRILLEEWAAEKKIYRDQVDKGLSPDLTEALLLEIAYKGFESDQNFFHKADLINQIESFISTNPNAPVLGGEDILKTIVIRQGILVERAQEIYSFSHLTLQEYLTAQYINENNQIKNLTEQHVFNRKWQEVFLLVAGLMRAKNGADELLLSIHEIAQKMIAGKLELLLKWVEQVTQTSVDVSESLKERASSVYFVFFFNLARSQKQKGNSNLDTAITRILVFARELSSYDEPISHVDIANYIAQALLLASASDAELDLDHVQELAQKLAPDHSNKLKRVITKAYNLAENHDIHRVLLNVRKFVRDIARTQEISSALLKNLLRGDIQNFTHYQTTAIALTNVLLRAQSHSPHSRLHENIMQAFALASALVKEFAHLSEYTEILKSSLEEETDSVNLQDKIQKHIQRLTIQQKNTRDSNELRYISQNIFIAQTYFQHLNNVLKNSQDLNRLLIGISQMAQALSVEIADSLKDALSCARETARHIALDLASSSNRNLALALAIDNAYVSAIERNCVLDKMFQKSYVSEDDNYESMNHFSSIRLSLDLAISISEDLSLTSLLKKFRSNIPTATVLPEIRQSFARDLRMSFLRAFKLNESLLQFSLRDIEKIENYFYINQLIFQCKKSSIRVSDKTWEAIQKEMLKPCVTVL
ncbi:MAG: NACHT domain-containing protein [Scytolyngbya sp. HA4215-MV1]|jgi:hypothetical protein|nr:NACHT domain-containing protein [Scytolyngbya sp. HA4215-MV1]